jgi:putative transposase
MRVVPRGKMKEVMAMLKAIHPQKLRQATREKAQHIAEKLTALRLSQAPTIVCDGVHETRSDMAFPDGNSAVMLLAARLRHIAGTRWGRRTYLDMDRLGEPESSIDQKSFLSRAQPGGEPNVTQSVN